MGEVAGALYGVETFIEGAVALAKGIYDPTLPLKATLAPISDLSLPRAYHTLSVVKGRAYIFGGKITGEDGEETLADNAMHIVILPSSGVESTDYKKIEPTKNTPSPRFGHSAAVIDDCIYVFGGSSASEEDPLSEDGCVWVFNTTTDSWSSLKPTAGGDKPDGRIYHASTASDQPQPVFHRTDEGTAPQLPPDPAKYVPEPPAPNTYGTVVVYGGTSGKGETLSDLYAFDVASKTWSDLPAPPPAASTTASSPTLAMVESRLYTFSSGHTHYLDLHKAPFNDKDGNSASGIKPLGPWSPIPSGLHPDKPGPGNRTGATLLPVTTGQGRNYLLLVGGESSTGQSSPSAHSDVWALQLNPEKGTAASVKDSVRTAIKMSTDEDEWAELKYYNTDGVEIKEGQFQNGVGKRKGYAAAKGTEVDGCSVLVWGGFGESGKALGDGLMITVER